jgi:hypothetical protein
MPRSPKGRYWIEPLGGTRRGRIRLSSDRFVAIAAARQRSIMFTGFEEKLHILAENYIELERSLLDIALGQLVWSGSSWTSFQDENLLINRRLANFLSSAKAYDDQVKRDLIKTLGRKDSRTGAFLAASETLAKEQFSRRIMGALRNYQQHQAPSIRGSTYRMRRRMVSETPYVVHTFTPLIDVHSLRRDGAFEGIADEIEALPKEKIELMPLVSEFLDGVAKVHKTLREAAAESLRGWESLLDGVLKQARRRFGKVMGVSLVSETGAGQRDETHLFEDLVKRRNSLERRSMHLGTGTLARHYVASRPVEESPDDEPRGKGR